MIRKCSNLVQEITLGYSRSDVVWVERSKVKVRVRVRVKVQQCGVGSNFWLTFVFNLRGLYYRECYNNNNNNNNNT